MPEYMNTEEYLGHKIWFAKHNSTTVEAKVYLDGMWYSILEPTKEQAFAKAKSLIRKKGD